MRPIGDFDSDELTLAERSAYGDVLRVPPPIPSGLGRFEPSGPAVISAAGTAHGCERLKWAKRLHTGTTEGVFR